jgi:hypothetical protein
MNAADVLDLERTHAKFRLTVHLAGLVARSGPGATEEAAGPTLRSRCEALRDWRRSGAIGAAEGPRCDATAGRIARRLAW